MVLACWQQYLNKKKLEEVGEETGAVLSIGRDVNIHNKVTALLFSFPSPSPPNYFSLWNRQGNNISFSGPRERRPCPALSGSPAVPASAPGLWSRRGTPHTPESHPRHYTSLSSGWEARKHLNSLT